MAIIIPSANIYEMQNDKMLENQISGVDVEENKIIVKNDYVGKTEKCVLIECINDDGGKGTFGPYTYYGTSTYTNVYNSDKNPQKNNTYIDTTHSNTYDMYRTDFTIDLSGYVLSTNFLSTVQIESYSTVKGEKSIYADNEFRGTTHYGTDTYTQIQSPNTSINHIEIGEASLINNKLSFSVYINKSIKPGVTVIGTSIYPIEYEIRIKGNFIEAETIANSYGTKSNLSLQSNELMQNTTKNGTKKISEHLANNIIYSYEKGKETATIRCSINNYYNEDNTIAKSITDTTKDMTFRMYDNVIPMIPSPNGDVPMSKHKDGTNKIFKVLGTKLINNGACWQELTLQET